MKRLIRQLAAKFRGSSPATITLLAVVYELILAWLDYTTPEEMSFAIFYVLAVAFVGWGAGQRSIFLVAAIATGVMAVHEYSVPNISPRGILLWNATTRFLLFYAVGWLTREITRLNRHLQKLVEARTSQLRAETQKHKATSARLSEALARLQTIIANVPMIFFAVDREGVITFEDGRALRSLGVSPGAHVGQSVLQAYGQSKEIPQHMQRALRGEEFSAPAEIGPVALETWYSPTRQPDGTIAGYTGVAVNVTGQRRLERQILEISDREQARLGQEIHDGLCQQLVSLAFDANSLERELNECALPQAQIAARIAKFLDKAITEARQLARGLFPIRLDAQGLPSALEELARATRERFGVDCTFRASQTAAAANKTMATHLYRIAQEAVTNAIRHGKARSIRLQLDDADERLELRVEDDGQGITAGKAVDSDGLGLHIMDYRARTIGGTFSFGPGAGGGISVCCCVPAALV